jgi:hypothetical protein
VVSKRSVLAAGRDLFRLKNGDGGQSGGVPEFPDRIFEILAPWYRSKIAVSNVTGGATRKAFWPDVLSPAGNCREPLPHF